MAFRHTEHPSLTIKPPWRVRVAIFIPDEISLSAMANGTITPVAFNDITVDYTAVGQTSPPNIRTCISKIDTATNGVSAVSLDAELTNFTTSYLTKSFRIATATNLTSGAWVTNSIFHSITGAVTTVIVTNGSDRAFFKIISD